jgi:putative FmdB family regulatory protein
MYEFECDKGHQFERLVTFAESEKPKQPCPGCKATVKVVRLWSRTGFPNLKGSGFYQNTYKRSEQMDKIVEQSE